MCVCVCVASLGGGGLKLHMGNPPLAPPTPPPANRQMSNGTCLRDGAQGHTAQGQITEQEVQRGREMPSCQHPPPPSPLHQNTTNKTCTCYQEKKLSSHKHADTGGGPLHSITATVTNKTHGLSDIYICFLTYIFKPPGKINMRSII